MNVFLISLVLAFAIILGAFEIPDMISRHLYREFWTFLILLVFGVVLAVLKILKVSIPNPSDAIAWVYSPITNLLRDFLK